MDDQRRISALCTHFREPLVQTKEREHSNDYETTTTTGDDSLLFVVGMFCFVKKDSKYTVPEMKVNTSEYVQGYEKQNSNIACSIHTLYLSFDKTTHLLLCMSETYMYMYIMIIALTSQSH